MAHTPRLCLDDWYIIKTFKLTKTGSTGFLQGRFLQWTSFNFKIEKNICHYTRNYVLWHVSFKIHWLALGYDINQLQQKSYTYFFSFPCGLGNLSLRSTSFRKNDRTGFYLSTRGQESTPYVTKLSCAGAQSLLKKCITKVITKQFHDYNPIYIYLYVMNSSFTVLPNQEVSVSVFFPINSQLSLMFTFYHFLSFFVKKTLQ